MLARSLSRTDVFPSKTLAIAGVVVLATLLYRFVPEWVLLAVEDDRYFYTLLAPLICAGMLWAQRKSIREPRPSDRADSGRLGWLLLSLALILGVAAWRSSGVPTLGVGAAVLSGWGLFLAIWGEAAARRLAFPLACLTLAVPLPIEFMHWIVTVLQQGSAELTHVLFRMTGMPVFRESAFEFALPGISIEVAEECSGIRSATTLFVSSVVAGYWLLDTFPQRASLVLLAIPISVLKNAIRIVALSWLGVYVDRGYFFGDLHHQGGLAFSLVAVILMFAAIVVIRQISGHKPKAATARSDARDGGR